MSSLYVISAVAKDQPGLAHRISQALSDMSINIVDIDARSVRGHFSMFLVVDLSTSTFSYDEMMERMSPIESKFELGLHVEPYEAGRRNPSKELMILTVMGHDRPGIVASVSQICAKNSVNIESIRMIARGNYIAMELSLDGSDLEDMALLREEYYAFSEETGLDVSLRDEDLFNKPKRVVIFDCDSTLVQGEVIDEMAEIAGVGARVKDVTARAMNGEIDFVQAIKERIRLLKGLTRTQLESIFDTVHLTPGAEDLIATLHFMGYKVGVVSGGFSFFTDYLKDRLNLDYVFANELEIKNGVVTGEIKGRIIDAQSKADILNEIAERENISPDQIVAVGDGANDRFMLQNAGLAIAFNPKDALKKYSNGMLSNDNLSGLLYFLGIPDAQMEKIKNGGT
ncbi:MAG: phosphoserine phosphatase SerB [Deltaproteobacteria bacterium]|nr:MAG: phosphoserine phosphatase SerB [Deltaproteobacteria bacterium]